jgi:hypothetical protein
MGKRTVELIRAPKVVQEQAADRRVAEAQRAADKLVEQPVSEHAAVAMVEQILAAGLGPTVAA